MKQTNITTSCKALKLDSGKSRVDLIDPQVLLDLGEVLSFGAGKYSDNNWMKGLKLTRVYASLIRHAFSWFKGEDLDKESGLSHLSHAMACLMILQSSYNRGIGEDDRPFKTPTMQ